MKNKVEVVCISDLHYPYQCDKVVDLEIDFCKDQQPSIIVLHELHDFYSISKFDKNPKNIDTLQKEIDMVDVFFTRIRKVCPKSRIILLNSNHLERLKKHLWRNSPALSNLRVLGVESLLELKKHRIEFMETFDYKGIHFKHGDVVRKFAGYTAKAEFENEGVSGVSGHSHKLNLYFQRSRGGDNFWIEGGCGCLLDQEYVKGVTNWQHGFVALQFDKKHCYPSTVPIINEQVIWGDKIYR